MVKTDPAGNIKPDKEKSVQKIDGIVASIMALGEWMTAQGYEDANPYQNRGMGSVSICVSGAGLSDSLDVQI